MFEFIFLFWGTQCWCHVGPAKKSYASCEDKLGHLNPGSLIYADTNIINGGLEQVFFFPRNGALGYASKISGV